MRFHSGDSSASLCEPVTSFAQQQIDALRSLDPVRVNDALGNIWLVNEVLSDCPSTRWADPPQELPTTDEALAMLEEVCKFLMQTESVALQASALSILPTYFRPPKHLRHRRILATSRRGDPEVSRSAAVALSQILMHVEKNMGLQESRRLCHEAGLFELADTITNSWPGTERSEYAWRILRCSLAKLNQ